MALRRHKINTYRDLDYEVIAARFIANYRKSARMNEVLRRQTIRSALDNGNRVVLVEIPNDENLIGLFDPVRVDYQTRVSNMVRDFAISHLVAQTRTSWTKPDFFDMHHLSPSGREKFVSVLADLLTPEIKPN